MPANVVRRALLVAGVLSHLGGLPEVAAAQDLPRAIPNDQRMAAGRVVDGEMQVKLDVVEAEWLPRGDRGPRIVTAAFAEAGGAPMVPGPMIRARAGTPVRVEIHNRLERPVSIRGLVDRATMRTVRPPGEDFVPLFAFADSMVVPPGERRETRFTPTADVSSFYFGSIIHPPDWASNPTFWVGNHGEQGAFMGAFVIDPPDAVEPDERVLMITRWGAREEPSTMGTTFKMMINGQSWPFTETLEYAEGDTVRWRVINASLIEHPMHLHGFFFDVLSRGDTDADTTYAPAARPTVVTERMGGYASMRIRWVADRPGNWIFHCHLNRHMGPLQRFDAEREGDAQPSPDDHDHMAGLVVGIRIRARSTTAETPAARRLHLWTGTRPDVFGAAPELGFVLQRDGVPRPDSTVVPGSTLVLRRGEPTEIVVHNRLDRPLSVHWHGLELDSRYDGVGDWSGSQGATRAPIAPDDSTVVRITPPRAGTFIYHVHGESGHELSQGLFGPLIVTERNSGFAAEHDRIFVLGARGATRDAPPSVNGAGAPPPERFQRGDSYRLRLLHISPDAGKRVRLLRDGQPVEWLPLAKDGADLPESARSAVPAVVTIGVGETYDFEWTPDLPGTYVLEVLTAFYSASALPPVLQRVAFGVGDVAAADLAAAARVDPPVPPPADTTPAIALPARAMAPFVGVYEVPGLPIDLRIELEGNHMYVTRTGRPRARVVPIGPVLFRIEGGGPGVDGTRLEFEVADGRTVALHWIVAPGDRMRMRRRP